MTIGDLYGMSVTLTPEGDVIVSAHGQAVLKISEVSDIGCINLFFSPIDAEILQSDYAGIEELDGKVRYELLATRSDKGKVLFKKYEPRFTITK